MKNIYFRLLGIRRRFKMRVLLRPKTLKNKWKTNIFGFVATSKRSKIESTSLQKRSEDESKWDFSPGQKPWKNNKKRIFSSFGRPTSDQQVIKNWVNIASKEVRRQFKMSVIHRPKTLKKLIKNTYSRELDNQQVIKNWINIASKGTQKAPKIGPKMWFWKLLLVLCFTTFHAFQVVWKTNEKLWKALKNRSSIEL